MRLREGKLISEWEDEYENKALIEEVEIKPHKEAKLEKVYRLSCYAEYDDNFCYHISIFDSAESAENQLKEFSCGSFRNILEIMVENILAGFDEKFKNSIYESRKSMKIFLKKYNRTDKDECIDRIKKIVNDLINRYEISYEEAMILFDYICGKEKTRY